MKKILFLLVCTATFCACTNKGGNNETKNNVLFAENIQSIVPLIPDSVWDEASWNAL